MCARRTHAIIAHNGEPYRAGPRLRECARLGGLRFMKFAG